MLSGRYRQHYAGLQQMVHQLQAIASDRLDLEKFQDIFLKVRQVVSSKADGDEDLQVKVQSYQTEINKQLRLLEIDLMFLKTTRQATKTEQRWGMMGDRLHLLVLYCDALLSEDF